MDGSIPQQRALYRDRLRVAVVTLTLLAAGGCESRTDTYTNPVTRGDPDRGATVIRAANCGSCHTIPGVRRARGLVGPPLTMFAHRSFIAGEVPNSPDNLVRWLQDPQSIEPGTAMPNLALTEQQARDAAAYLYTLQ